MAVKKTLVEIAHDEGYGYALLEYININLRGKDMRAERIVTIQESVPPKDGGPAFPSQAYDDGMTLRDWFATHASESDVKRWKEIYSYNGSPLTEEEAKYAYADAMIAQRSKQTNAPST